MFNWLFGNKTENYKIGDRVHIKGEKTTSEKKRAVQPNPDVYVIYDISDGYGYKLNMEDSAIMVQFGYGGWYDKQLYPAPDEHKNFELLKMLDRIKSKKK